MQDIFNAFQGNTLKQDMGIVEVWDLHNERIEKLIGKEIVLVTYQKYLVSELLGHMKLATTQQSYGKIVQKRVGEEMNRVNSRIQLNNKNEMSK